MLDIPGASILDKRALIGGAIRLRLAIDAERLHTEVALLPSSVWGTTAGRVGVHAAAEALFLCGYAPAEGERPLEDRPVLDSLPYARSIIKALIPSPHLRCVLARLPPATLIRLHKDLPPYFSKSLRLHVPVHTNPEVFMVAAGLTYRMRPGEVWALNNSALHGVWNAHPTAERTHLICDFLPSPELLILLAAGERDLGEPDARIEHHLRMQRSVLVGR